MSTPATTSRPPVGFWQIWNMCFGFMGLQFGLALQNANVSRIFQTLGASIDDIPALWIAAPLTGLLVQPIIGYCSDRTWGRLGRRRPYFLAGAIIAALALIAMPNSPTLWSAAALLWLLDAAINVSMGPLRSFVGDQLPSSQRPAGYAMQTMFIAAGAVIASLLPWLLAQCGVSNLAAAGGIPDTVKLAFYLGAAVLFGTLAWTVLSTREYPPDALAAFEDEAPATPPSPVPAHVRYTGMLWCAAGLAAFLAIRLSQADARLHLLAAGLFAYGAIQLIAGYSRARNPITAIIADLLTMPTIMRQLVPVQCFSWFALFAMWIYTTAAVTGVHFATEDTRSAAYNDGANWAGVLFAAYNGFAVLAAMLIPWMTRRLGLRLSHMLNLVLGGCGLLSFLLIRDPHWLLLSMVGVGFAWASILSLPYALLSDSVPAGKMGVYMGIFNLFIVIPQLLAASILGFLLKTFFGNAPICAMLIGGVSLLLAALCVVRVGKVAEGDRMPVV
ncbi:MULTISPECIES: MFS transporter [unclassified Lysobacter]|uniref:MFS transporter n=1 Tax=unclassified Lysobacter TaxID=2635362 RepID=UPI0006F793B0|nr:MULTISPECIES: MFS transporter [unclassified Lysobacter]KQZ56969.1 MFS transporter [Lysobacter sp. Root559]KRC34811.1 MFS transporter [Lysobacter sp. Root76]KRD70500.1 MFS transporter [Lysobacter sp. Root96]